LKAKVTEFFWASVFRCHWRQSFCWTSGPYFRTVAEC